VVETKNHGNYPEEINMTSPIQKPVAFRMLTTLFCTSLIACGGGGAPGSASPTASNASPQQVAAAPVGNAAAPIAPMADAAPSHTVTAPLIATSATAPTVVTDVRFENTNSQAAQVNQPVTFGQVFSPGHVLPSNTLVGRFDDGTTLPLQTDVKALHPDGSVRHAIISAVLPNLAAGQVRTVALEKTSTAPATKTYTVDDLMRNGFSASVHAKINGVEYAAYADDALKDTVNPKTWLAGPIATEWLVSAPLTTDSGQVHPHLSARFAIRWYSDIKKVRVDVTVENDWAYEPAPQNFTYDAQVLVAAKQVYSKPALTHLHHARWRKVFWWGAEGPQVHVKHNTAYLIGTRALPNYDQTLIIPESALAALKSRWTGAITEPMAVGLAMPGMPTTGGRDDIGLLPAWAAQYLLSMDKRAKEVTTGTADLAGSWSAHYRDRNTDRPISPIDYPYMTILGIPNDTYNPATKKFEKFPTCATTTACTSPNTHDVPHQPSFAYLPYLVTGDHYYLEELQFWAMYNGFSSNPGYRQFSKGLFQSDQVRGQAWALRTLSEAAYISPDNDRLKSHFTSMLKDNLDWYNNAYTNNASANVLGFIANGYAVVYENGTGLAPWMDDFFTSAVGHAAELGFTQAEPLLRWKAKFPIQRMIGAGACWIDGAIYAMIVKNAVTGQMFTTIEEAYRASHTAGFNALACNSPAMAASLGLKLGEMTGYSALPAGYPSNMQPGLAYAADVGGIEGKNAWAVFMARSVKPDYRTGPQFAIVPR
jgi:hypothetical protein